jgi:hypothetical protein
MPADGILAARSHARISATPASRAATQNLTDFTGTLYPQLGGSARSRCPWFEVRVGSKCEELEPSIFGPVLPSKADVRADAPVSRVRANRVLTRRSKKAPLFDQLVCERKQIVGNLDAERLGRLEID